MRISILGLAAAIVWIPAQIRGAVPVTCVAYFGMPAPGGLNFTSFDHAPFISLAGTITFVGTAGNSPGNQGVWSGTVGQLTLLAHADQPIPNNAGTLKFKTIPGFNVTSLQGGLPVFAGVYSDAQSNSGSATWKVESNATSLIAMVGAPAPGTSSANFNSRPSPFMTSSGNYGFVSTLFGGDTTAANNTGVWASTNSGSLQLIARTGTQVPGLSSGVQWQTLDGGELGLPDGSVLLRGGTNDGRIGYWSSDGISTTPIALDNSPVPGLPIGNDFAQVRQPTINTIGDLAFYDGDIWLKNSSGFHKSVAVGQPAPGGGTFTLINSLPEIADDDTIVFQATTSDGLSGLFRNELSGIERVAQVGEQVPGLASGTTFSRLYRPTIAPNGAIAFIADVKSSSGATSINYLFGCLPGDVPQLIAGAGTQLPTTGGSFATVSRAYLYSRDFDDIAQTQFDSNGNLVFTILDTNLTNEVYIAQLPEPTGLVSLGIMISLLRRRRK